MCGITGSWRSDACSRTLPSREVLDRMVAAVEHRGPDAKGVWEDKKGRAIFGHARLAVVDLSINGNQPFVSQSGRFVITYNGEVFSCAQLSRELRQSGFLPRGHSDTELIVEHAERFGLPSTLNHLNGMFAFALFERDSGDIWLVRDHLGVKPLYYTFQEGQLTFGSELFSVQLGSGKHHLSEVAVSELLATASIPAPLTILDEVNQLEPGSYLHLSSTGRLEEHQYWSLLTSTTAPRLNLDDHEAIRIGREHVEAAIVSALASDVEVGVLLSGGIDSSLVAAVASKAKSDLRAFSLSVGHVKFDESQHARRVADTLGIAHSVMSITDRELLELVDQLPHVYQEPFADSSQIPTLALARKVREEVSVVLTGDGGDEVFAGYDRHVFGGKLMAIGEHIPKFIRNRVGIIDSRVLFHALLFASSRVRNGPNLLNAENKISRFTAAISNLDDPLLAYQSLAGHQPMQKALVHRTVGGFVRIPSRVLDAVQHLSWSERIQLFDAVDYLPNDLLVKVDRATMSVGLEARVPLLDHRLVEWAWRLPLHLRSRDGQGKWLLRQLLADHFPVEFFARPKQGFAVPLNDWLRGPLQPWAQELLSDREGTLEGFLNWSAVEDLWRQQQAGRSSAHTIWPVLMLLSWLRQQQQLRIA